MRSFGVPEIEQIVGSKDQLSKIEEAFQNDRSQGRNILLVHEIGGTGKTQLAIASMREQRDDYSTVVWLNSKTEGTIKKNL